ncbi:hypothetical protein RC083_21005 [Pseudoalteromonas haloplanktis]|uniref:Glycosyl transferase family 1 domain-containing protein n=1 Tax=Pseudoalteromonas haloplanktis TaxID=228 RepID=A0ABU1BHZ5_PSEHA|nr:glycosyltransferase [Pseudoalteromonas haloplanktis]MDQ9094045.1 hypothetical protein [Pseudoalteromonas haloplanktis]
MKLVIYCPGTKVGGTNTLFARCAEYWEKVTGYKPVVIDFEDGIIKNYLTEKNVDFDFREHTKGKLHFFESDELVIMPVLSGRMLGYKLFPKKDTRIAFWVTHPHDPFKWLPTFQLVKKWRAKHKFYFGMTLHPHYFPKLRQLFEKSNKYNGLYVMDSDCSDSLNKTFGLELKNKILPVFTDHPEATLIKNKKLSKELKFCWIGRVADFKWRSIVILAKEIDNLKLQGVNISFDIVGDGCEFLHVKKEVEKLQNPNIRMLGTLSLDELNLFIKKEVDIFCGHGIALLEAAKHKVPCIVANGTYFDFDLNEMNFNWFYELEKGDVGKILSNKKEIAGVPFSELFKGVDSGNLIEKAENSYSRWKECHSPEVVVKNLYGNLLTNKLIYEELTKTGFLKFDLIGLIIMKFKRYITREKY